MFLMCSEFNKFLLFLQSNCGRLVDKYIEYDAVIVCLDALLLKVQAFRHVLYNSHIQVRSIPYCHRLSSYSIPYCIL